jgi:hypothetical protein
MSGLRHQHCRACGRMQRFEFAVNSELWLASGCTERDGPFCIECWLERVDRVIGLELSVDDFQFLAVVGENAHCTILDTVDDHQGQQESEACEPKGPPKGEAVAVA